MNSNPSPAVPRLALLALTLAVLLVHGWLLQAAPQALGMGPVVAPEPPPLSFVTRTITVVPAAPPPSAEPPVARAPRPSPVAVPAPAPAPKAATQSPVTPPTPMAPGEPPPEETETATEPAPKKATDTAENTAALADTLAVPQTAPTPAPQDQAQQPTPAPPEAASPLPPAAKLPASVRLKYAVLANKFPFSLNAELLWQHDGTGYNARLAFSAFGQSRVQTSQGDVGPQGLAPTRFSDKYRTELAAHFNRALGKITFSANTPDAPLMAGAQDRLSVLVQLATLLASAPNDYPPATTLTLQTVGPREASPWLFTVQAPETLTLPGGEQATLKLVRLPRRDYDQKVELWLAPALGYLPARIRITEHNGDYIDQQWLATEAVK